MNPVRKAVGTVCDTSNTSVVDNCRLLVIHMYIEGREIAIYELILSLYPVYIEPVTVKQE
jgi:hypothetical protein